MGINRPTKRKTIKEAVKRNKPKHTLRGLKIVISDLPKFTRDELDQLRYAIAKVLIKFGDKKIHPPFKRTTGISIKSLQNQFGNTIYLASQKERKLAKSILDNLQPKVMDGAITLSPTCKEVNEEQFKRKLYTVRTHVA